MKVLSVVFALSIIASSSAASLDVKLQQVAVSKLPRGGGIFSDVVRVAESESAKITERAKEKAAELDETAEQLRDEALRRAQDEIAGLEKEAQKLATELERAARIKAAELRRTATNKASEYKKIAQDTALQVASRWEKETAQKLAQAEKAVKKKAAEVEKLSRKRSAALEKSYGNGKNGVLSGVFNSIVSRKSRQASTVATKQSSSLSPLLSKKASALLAHVLLLAMACTSLTNIFGWPREVIEHWEGGFGERFFPFEGISLTQKRILAGAMEMSSIFFMRPKKARAFGTGLITAMYTWGTVVNAQLNQSGKAVILAVLSAMAWLLLANEVF